MITLRSTYQKEILQTENKIKSDKKLELIVTCKESNTVNVQKASLLKKLKKGPIMNDEQYKEYVEGRKWWNNSRL